jgi:hypothetical protein
MKVKFFFPFHEMLSGDHKSSYAQVQELTLHENPHSKEMGYNGICRTFIAKIQVMISIKIHVFNKITFGHGYHG